VTDKAQEVDNFEDMCCEACRERIYERNFDARNRDRDTSAICEECLDLGKHLRCMNNTEKFIWDENRVWYCEACYANLSDSEDEYGSENNFSELSLGNSSIAIDMELFEAL